MSPRKRTPRNAKNKRGRGNCPVDADQTYEVDVVEMSPRGEGIARVKGFPVFIPNAKLGDHVTVKITNLNSVNADGEIVS